MLRVGFSIHVFGSRQSNRRESSNWQPFLAQNGPKTHSKRPNEGKRLLNFTCASRNQEPFLALWLHDMSKNRSENGPKWPECALFVSNGPKTKKGPYLGLRGSRWNSEGS